MAKKKTDIVPEPEQSLAEKTVKKTLIDKAKEDITQFGFFACEEIKNQIAVMAEQNGGELTEEQLDLLVSANTQSIAKLQSLCNFIKLLDSKVDICKLRKKEINDAQKKVEGIVERICNRLAAWVKSQGSNTHHVGEYELATRLSKSVHLVDGFEDPFYCKVEMVRVVTPDKAAIKKALEAGEVIDGAFLVEHVNLQIK